MTTSANQTISEQEIEAEKVRLIKLVHKEAQKHALVDLTAFVNANTFIDKANTHSGFVRSIAYKLEKTGSFEIIALKDWTEFYIKKISSKPFRNKFPTLYALFFVIIGAFSSVGLDYVKNFSQGQLPRQEINTLQTRIEALSDSVKNVRQQLINMQDSLKKTTDSTSSRNKDSSFSM